MEQSKDQLPDLLADAEEEEARRSIRAKLAENAARVASEPRSPPTAGVLWEDDSQVYLPRRVDARALVKGLKPEQPPEIPAGSISIFVDRPALRRIMEHLRANVSVEQGGLLLGTPFCDASLSSYVVVVHDCQPVQSGIETETTFTYTAESWRLLMPRIESMVDEWTIVGSYHSHPGFGVFMSSTDIETQEAAFNQEWQLAAVVDPVVEEIGWFTGKRGAPCERWYVVDPA